MIEEKKLILKQKDDRYHEVLIVLCEWRGEFVTWIKDKDREVYHFGHYFGADRDAAERDFEKRN